jgi:hypothetical protein
VGDPARVTGGGDDFAASARTRTAVVLVAWAGAIAAAVNAGVIAPTFLPRPPHLPPPATTISWVVSIPILAAAVFLVRDGGTDGSWRS